MGLQKRIDAAMGRIPCDLQIRGARYLDVFSCEWREGDLSIIDGAIIGVESGLKATRVIEGKGKWVVPGFIDAHVHVESSMMVPSYFQQAVLARGTTSVVSDPHELTNVLGARGLDYFLDCSSHMALDMHVMLSSCVPATHLETNGGGAVLAPELAKRRDHARALGLAEMMNVPGVLNADPVVMAKIDAFSGRPLDGHSPLLRGRELSAYLAAGISSCHESSELEEAREKLQKGMAVWIREGSVAKDLKALIPLLTLATSTSIGFCTDDRNPLDILKEGHIDHLVRGAIRAGVKPEIAYRASSWTVARHYGLRHRGAVAPGFVADLVILGDPKTVAVEQVLKAGVPTTEIGLPQIQAQKAENTMRAQTPAAQDLVGPSGNVHVIEVEHGKIITHRKVAAHDAPGVARLSVLERYGHGSKPANAYVSGFGTGLRGAIASSVGHDSHNLIVVGDTAENMRVALASLIECGGGFSVVQNGKVSARLPLPFGGLMTHQGPPEIAQALLELQAASRSIGCELPEPFLQLAFLSLPVIPELKLTDKGLVDVNRFQVIDVRAS